MQTAAGAAIWIWEVQSACRESSPPVHEACYGCPTNCVCVRARACVPAFNLERVSAQCRVYVRVCVLNTLHCNRDLKLKMEKNRDPAPSPPPARTPRTAGPGASVECTFNSHY